MIKDNYNYLFPLFYYTYNMTSSSFFKSFNFRFIKIVIITIILILFFVSIILIIQVLLSRKTIIKRERLTPLESGFESLKSSIFIRAPFFFMAILFVLFDMELILFFPGVMYSFINKFSLLLWLVINFVVVFTLMIEWSLCGLKWQI